MCMLSIAKPLLQGYEWLIKPFIVLQLQQGKPYPVKWLGACAPFTLWFLLPCKDKYVYELYLLAAGQLPQQIRHQVQQLSKDDSIHCMVSHKPHALLTHNCMYNL